jgi:hypothetical protein
MGRKGFHKNSLYLKNYSNPFAVFCRYREVVSVPRVGFGL